SAYLEQLVPLYFESSFCSHEGIIPKGKERSREKSTYVKITQKSVREVHEEGFTDKEIVKTMFPRPVMLETITFGAFARKNYIRACYQKETERVLCFFLFFTKKHAYVLKP